jgi:hypothetical protein
LADARIAPDLLDYIDDYVEETDFNSAVRGSGLDSGSNLIVFYRELFAQLFANVIGERITGVGQRSGERARALYRSRGRQWSPALRVLVREFQHFCKIYPDLLGEEYGGGNEAVSDLHFDLLPGLLDHLEQWARGEGDRTLADRTAAASKRYGEFVETFEPV